MDQQVIETPLDDRRKEDFFCDVAIREVCFHELLFVFEWYDYTYE